MKITGCYVLVLAFGCLIHTSAGYTQTVLAHFSVTVSAMADNTASPQTIDLDAFTQVPDSVVALVELKGDRNIPVLCQIERGERRYLHWMVVSGPVKQTVHQYQLLQQKTAPYSGASHLEKNNGSLLVSKQGHHPLVNYHFATSYPPAGVDTVFKRSGFIHPLYAPHGQVLTRINPPDHHHHYGLWNPWTKVAYQGRIIDFWNLGSKEGTVRFSKFLSANDGPVYSEYQVLHEHVVFEKDGTETIPMTEVQTVRVYQPGEKDDYYLMDITIQLNCTTDSEVVLKEYRYGGLGWRATEKWDRSNSEILTSEGKNRKEADGSRARWVVVQGKIDTEDAGVVMMSHPGNYNFPEPLRVWPEDMNGRGDVYANFSPTKNKDWHLLPGKNNILKYRLLVFNGHVNKDQAESAWQQYAVPTAAIMNIVKK